MNKVYWTPTSGSGDMTDHRTVGPDNAGELAAAGCCSTHGDGDHDAERQRRQLHRQRGDSLRPAVSGPASATTVNVSGGTTFLDSNSGVNFSVDDDADLTYNVTGSTFRATPATHCR